MKDPVERVGELEAQLYEKEKQHRSVQGELRKDKAVLEQRISIMEAQVKEAKLR